METSQRFAPLYGPFWHQLNAGGLEDIVANGRLLSTRARGAWGGAEGVRAHPGVWVNDHPRGAPPTRPVIEFVTTEPPGEGVWRCAEWRVPEGEYLRVIVTRIHHPNGTTEVPAPHHLEGSLVRYPR